VHGQAVYRRPAELERLVGGAVAADVADDGEELLEWPILLKKSVSNLRLVGPAIRRPSIGKR